MDAFDPNGLASPNATIFGLPHTEEEAYIHILPVSWEVTTSYRAGTAFAPQEIREASFQVDLYTHLRPEGWKRGYFLMEENAHISSLNRTHRAQAKSVIDALSQGNSPENDEALRKKIVAVNQACEEMNCYVYEQTLRTLKRGKKSILLGGDHSTPLGHLRAIAEYEQHDFSVLVIDAHMDMRCAYEHFTYSHASIFYNALQTLPSIRSLAMLGIRDYCENEKNYAAQDASRIHIFYNHEVKRRLFEGESWKVVVSDILQRLPQDKVYVSVDIDGLNPAYCPNTGTPVPGGIDIDQFNYLMDALYASGKTIIGADLCEVGHSANEWDANVGARVLYKLCTLIS